jgi:hypothetical protein
MFRRLEALEATMAGVLKSIERETGWKGFVVLGGLDGPNIEHPGDVNMVT